MRKLYLLLSFMSLYLFIPTTASAALECGGEGLPSCGATSAEFIRGVPGFFDCPAGSFRDPIRGGECWSCPPWE